MRRSIFYLDSDYPRRRLKFATVYGDRRGMGCSLAIIAWAVVMIIGFGVAVLAAKSRGWIEWFSLLAGIGVFGWLAFRALLDILAYAPARRRYEALLQGKMLDGEVVKARLKGKTLDVTYRFRAPNGRTLTGSQRRKFRRAPVPPAPGTHVQILFTDAHTHVML